MKIAALDFGSNTTLMLICDINDGIVTHVDCDETRITKMGQGVHESRRFHPEALARIEEALKDYKALIDKHRPDFIFAVATSAARDVENSQQLFDLSKRYGITIEVISGSREAELTYIGAFAERKETQNCCVIDIGGGSTEVISRQLGIIQGESVDIGSVRLMDLFGKKDPIASSDLKAMREYVRSKLNPNWNKLGFRTAIGVAGTPTILACMERGSEFRKEEIDGFILKKSRIQYWIDHMKDMDLETRENIPGLPAKRADVILAGTVILWELLDHLGLEQIEVSTFGVRYGVALNYSKTKTKA